MIDTTLQRIYRFLVGRDRPYTSKEIAIALQLDIDEVGKVLIEGRDKYFVQPAVFQWALKDEITEGIRHEVENDSQCITSEEQLFLNHPQPTHQKDSESITSNLSKLGHKLMDFQFPQTQTIAEQIAQLQQQLNQLTASLEPYKECEQRANELLQQIAEHAQLMRDKGIEERSLVDWGGKLYYQVTGEQNDLEAVNLLRSDNISLIEKTESLERENIELRDKLRRISVSSVEAAAKLGACEQVNDQLRTEILRLREQQHSVPSFEEIHQENKELQSAIVEATIEQLKNDNSNIQAIKAEDAEEINGILQVGTIVQRQDGQVGKVTFVPEKFSGELIIGAAFLDGNSNTHAANLKIISQPEIEIADTVKLIDACGDEDLEGFVGRAATVVGVNNDSVSVLFRNADGLDNVETIVHKFGLRILGKNPGVVTQIKISEFVDRIKTKKSAEAIAWEQVKEVCQNLEHLKELSLACTTKTQKDWFAKIPELLADYINRTGDKSDLDWIGDTARAKVEAMIK